MSGHSKWSTIKRQKGAADAKRSTTFTKLAQAITIAAREGGGDASSNFRLRLTIDKARTANMPKDNIERAIKRGTGELGGEAFSHLTYEAYAPGGAALIIEVDTDNKNRAVASIKTLLTKYGGKLAETGAVSYLFQPRGMMTVSGGNSIELAIIDSGAEDYELIEEDHFIVFTLPKETAIVAKRLEESGLKVADMTVNMEPLATVAITEPKTVQTLSTLIEQLEDLDDVSSVATNVAFGEELNKS